MESDLVKRWRGAGSDQANSLILKTNSANDKGSSLLLAFNEIFKIRNRIVRHGAGRKVQRAKFI